MKKLGLNACLLALSFGLALSFCEFLSRLVLDPADFLKIELVHDDVLGIVPSAATKAGYDAWGFRNPKVPDHADIVAIGDSHTYGNTARMEDSWPMVLGHMTGRTVYNMGMGGYGPNQYYYLLKTKALNLKPRLIICGLYMGDDFENAYQITYGLDYWKDLRELPSQQTNYHIWETQDGPVWHKRIRVWLSRHSVVYQLLLHSSFLGRFQGEAQIKIDPKVDPSVTALVMPEKNILEAFRPEEFARALDQQNPNIREGMRITFHLLQDMKQICDQNQIQFLVVVIPTKETVFWPYIERQPQMPLHDAIEKVFANEQLARDSLFAYFHSAGISSVDALPAMRASAEHRLYARTAQDTHPSRNGYRVIAETLAGALKQDQAFEQP
ncbi:MAG: hypothetical protein WB952_12020 [Terriglobales bacterium]